MDKDIKKLAEHFMAGQTSVEEEKTLAEYFRSHDVSDEWRAYKEMFAWFDEGMPLENKKPVRRATRRNKFIAFATAAAAIALILTTVLPRLANDMPTDGFKPNAQNFCKIPAMAADTVTADTARASEPIRKNMRNASRKHLYRPAHPKVYLAQSIQDSINEQANLLAEEELYKIYKEQEEMMQEIKRQYELQDRNIELIMASMEEDGDYETEENIYY